MVVQKPDAKPLTLNSKEVKQKAIKDLVVFAKQHAVAKKTDIAALIKQVRRNK